MGRITPAMIDKVSGNQIFVFGSNESGIHGAGAAKKALEFGACMGQKYGLQGNAFAIPTKAADVRTALQLPQIKEYINTFFFFARSRRDLDFLVTEIGCGYAGYTPADIAPLFKECSTLMNVSLPEAFWDVLLDMGM